jgi:hypothetical protein
MIVVHRTTVGWSKPFIRERIQAPTSWRAISRALNIKGQARTQVLANAAAASKMGQNLIFARLSSDTEVAPGWPWALVW